MNVTGIAVAIISVLSVIGPSRLSANHNQTLLRG